MNKALFLDRDGVINVDKGYVYQYSEIIWIKEIFEVIKMANDLDYKVIILTNQSGIARGMYQDSDVELLHKEMLSFLSSKSLKITDIFYCAQMEGEFRKPAPGMLYAAQQKHNIDLSQSIMVGDKVSDVFNTSDLSQRPKTFLIKGNYSFENIDSLRQQDPRIEICQDHGDLLDKIKIFLK